MVITSRTDKLYVHSSVENFIYIYVFNTRNNMRIKPLRFETPAFRNRCVRTKFAWEIIFILYNDFDYIWLNPWLPLPLSLLINFSLCYIFIKFPLPHDAINSPVANYSDMYLKQ